MKKFIILISAMLAAASFTALANADTAVYGDADNNGRLEVNDASVVLKKVLKDEKMPVESRENYMDIVDVNGDKVLDSADVAEILQMILDAEYKPSAVPERETTTEKPTETTTEKPTETTTEKANETTTEKPTEATTDKPTEVTTGDYSDGVVVDNFADLKKELAKKNNKVYVKGTIECTERIRLSDPNANVDIVGITNPDGTAATLDFAKYRDSLKSSGSGGTGISIGGSYYNFSNIIIQNAGDCGIRISGNGSGYCTFENCVFRYNNNSGVSVTNGGAHNTFRFVDSYRNADLIQKNGADADGFSVKLSAGEENRFYNCRAWENSDDGWDSYDRDRPYIGSVYYEECLAWNNGNPYAFTGEYDYEHGFPLDKNLIYVQEILKNDPDFEAKYNSHSVTSWPNVTVKLLGTSNSYNNIHSRSWAGNPNGFKFGSASTPSSSYRYIKNCIAFDHANTPNQTPAKGFDQNNGCSGYDIENALSFNNAQNYWMDRMKANSMKGVFYSIEGSNTSTPNAPGDLSLTVPDSAKAKELTDKVYAYRDMIYSYVYNDRIPGEQICDVF